MDAVTHLAPTVGTVAACDFLGVARASFYRHGRSWARHHRQHPSWLCRWSGLCAPDSSVPQV